MVLLETPLSPLVGRASAPWFLTLRALYRQKTSNNWITVMWSDLRSMESRTDGTLLIDDHDHDNDRSMTITVLNSCGELLLQT
jgi:hypothetical protein